MHQTAPSAPAKARHVALFGSVEGIYISPFKEGSQSL